MELNSSQIFFRKVLGCWKRISHQIDLGLGVAQKIYFMIRWRVALRYDDRILGMRVTNVELK
jgi:hypothetical protein